MTREEHLAWCKKRALAYLPGDPRQAIMSMLSDMNKHEETRKSVEGFLAAMGLGIAAGGDPNEARRYIEGFS